MVYLSLSSVEYPSFFKYILKSIEKTLTKKKKKKN